MEKRKADKIVDSLMVFVKGAESPKDAVRNVVGTINSIYKAEYDKGLHDGSNIIETEDELREVLTKLCQRLQRKT